MPFNTRAMHTSRLQTSPSELVSSKDVTDSHEESQSTGPVLPGVIQDSQVDFSDNELDNTKSSSDLDDFKFHTANSGVQPSQARQCWRLHDQGINCNGRLPCEAPRFNRTPLEEELSPTKMNGTATQPLTQPYLDPRRQGVNDKLSDQDEADIICILLPTSPPAHEAVKLTAEAAPQHIFQNHNLSQIDDVGDGLEYIVPLCEKTQDNEDVSDRENTVDYEPKLNSAGSEGLRPARDIALRFSSRVHNLCLGFTFGRNAKVSDLILSSGSNKQVSNRHFRIFINKRGVLMLEDTSTNGTIVDGVVLRGSHSRKTEQDLQPQHTLSNGAIIDLPTITRQNGESVRFVVSMPTRNKCHEKYYQNLATYLACVEQAERQATATANAVALGNPVMAPPTPMKAFQPGLQQETTPNGSILAAATDGNNHGLHWNGGDKYNVVNYIGKGAFAMVYKLSSKRYGEVYAVKEIEKRRFIKDGVLGNKVHNEINVIKNLRHPNIVKYIDHYETKTHLFIVMEFVPCGDLSAYTNVGSAMPEFICQQVARQMLQALDYLHKRGITHRDIKPDNILLGSTSPWIFKLSDFGLSKIVTNEETFLKTFCGTLLYCAPEIYPGYQRVKLGLPPSAKRTRASDGPRSETLPYKHSVDIWSLSAVLYHLLCGRSPFTGTGEDQGAMMLVTIMRVPVDWDRLRQAGISTAGIDFVSRMLVTDPILRARDAALLAHSWVTEVPDVPGIEFEASQLSLADNAVEGAVEDAAELEYDEENDDDTDDPRELKRLRPWAQTDVEDDGLGDLLRGQNLPAMAGARPNTFHPPLPPQRLFGEIGTSALRSSGVLGQDAHAALEVPGGAGGSYDPSATSAEFVDSQMSGGNDPEGVSDIHQNYVSQHLNQDEDEDGVTRYNNIQYPQLPLGSTYSAGAPSLFGTEALVGRLNMASVESRVSAPSSDTRPVSPQLTGSDKGSPTLPGSKRDSQDLYEDDTHTTSKRSKFDLQPPSPATRLRSGDTAARDASLAVQDSQNSLGLTTATAHTEEIIKPSMSTSDSEENESDQQQSRERRKSNVSLVPTAYNSQDSAQDSNDGDRADSKPNSRRQSTSSDISDKPSSRHQSPTSPTMPSSPSTTRSRSTNNGPAVATQDDAIFVKPPIRFGNLIPIKGSVPTVPKIKIASRATTFGRAPESTFVHNNSMEDRVPKNAIDIQMWYPTMEKDITAGCDPFTHKDLTALISTRTSRYIKVNGIRLMKGRGCWLYGKLRTGDIVSVFELPEGQRARKPKDNDFLRFRCEFFVGASRDVRKEGETFKVEKEEEKYNKMVARKSRESTEAGDARKAAEPQARSGANAPMTRSQRS